MQDEVTPYSDSEHDAMRAKLIGLEACNAKLAAALKPFAELAELFDDKNRGGTMPESGQIYTWRRPNKEYELTVEHLRDARAALYDEQLENTDLLACPFCGGNNLMRTSNSDDNLSVACNSCGAEGPGADSEEASTDAWNHRHKPLR